MKHENSLRLARLASANCWNGGSSALSIAHRALALTGSDSCLDIVRRVYTRTDGKAVFECRECGSSHLEPEDAAQCCSFSEEDDSPRFDWETDEND